MNIFIVDDEAPIRDYIAKCVITASSQNAVRTFSSAKKLLAYMEVETPDLIFADITMPKISGLELLQKVKNKYEDIIVIILTCHTDFEFARAAIKYNADGYILKDELNEKMMSVLLENLAEKTYYKKTNDLSIRYLSVDEESDQLDKHLSHIKDLIKELYYFIVVFPGENNNIDYFKNKSPEFVEKQELYLYDNQNDIIIIILKRQPDFKQNEINFNVYIKDIVLNCDGLFGISNLHNNYKDLKKSLSESLDDRNRRYYGKTISSQSSKDTLNNSWNTLQNLSNKAIYLLQAGDIKGFCDNVISILDYVENVQQIKVNDLKTIFSHLFSLNKKNEIDIQNTITFYDLKKLVTDLLNELKMNAVTYSESIEKTIEYINCHYNENISLKRMAELVFLNVDYLGRQFKKEVGVKFSEYLQHVRMKKAKDLLLTTKLNIGEIAAEVGIVSSSYFSAVFFKEFGIAPNEMRGKHGHLK